nr:uncharacterized protein LOC125980893 isoform X2 [Syngnathus scovelli]
MQGILSPVHCVFAVCESTSYLDKNMSSKSITFKHLQPLSKYGKAVFAERCPNAFPEPLAHFKFQPLNIASQQQRVDDSSQDRWRLSKDADPNETDDGYSSMCLTPSLPSPPASSSILNFNVEVSNIGSPVLESSVSGKEDSPQDHDKEEVAIPSTSMVSKDWEQKKRMYVRLVHKHVNEASNADQDAVGEMQGLMAQVGYESRERPWQHPSDLTCRMYKVRLRKGERKISLAEWKSKNSGTQRRFENLL